jgi:phage baseplate assembly protein V
LPGKIVGMDTAELFRLISNLIRVGNIIETDFTVSPAKVRVQAGDLDTDWVQWKESRAGDSKTWDPPSVGEQVLMLCPMGETSAAIILCGLNSDANPAPSADGAETVRTFKDGARIAYNASTGALTASGVKSVLAQASEQITLKAPQIILDGKTTVKDLFSYMAGMSGQDGAGADGAVNKTSIKGNINHSDGSLTSNGVTLDTHDHGGVERGGDNTNEPNKS